MKVKETLGSFIGSLIGAAVLFVVCKAVQSPMDLCNAVFRRKYTDGMLFFREQLPAFLICLALLLVLFFLPYMASQMLHMAWTVRIGKRTRNIGFSAFLRVLLAAGCIGGTVYACSVLREPASYVSRVEHVSSRIIEEKIVSHSGGSITDAEGNVHYYVGAVPTLENTAAHDLHYIEIDMARTKDHALVCIHSWKYLIYPDGRAAHKRMTLEDFRKGKIHGIYPPMTFTELADYMVTHPEVRIITDIKKNDFDFGLAYIAEHVPEELLERFIVQIYHQEDYEKAKNLGFDYMIYTLYKTTEEERSPQVLRAFAAEHPLVSLTISVKFSKDPLYFAELAALPVPVFVYTIDDPALANDYLSRGASAIYSNNLEIGKELL